MQPGFLIPINPWLDFLLVESMNCFYWESGKWFDKGENPFKYNRIIDLGSSFTIIANNSMADYRLPFDLQSTFWKLISYVVTSNKQFLNRNKMKSLFFFGSMSFNILPSAKMIFDKNVRMAERVLSSFDSKVSSFDW